MGKPPESRAAETARLEQAALASKRVRKARADDTLPGVPKDPGPHLSGHTGKKAYKSQNAALTAASRNSSRFGGVVLHAYHCDHFDHWHLGGRSG